MHHLTNEGLLYMNKNHDNIDEKLLSEFKLFVLNIFASNTGVKLGTHKKQYEKSNLFISKIIKELQKGV